MANLLNFKMGLQQGLAGASLKGGTVYVTTDERAMYIDIDDNTRIRLGDFRIVASFEELQNQSDSWATTCLYYVTGSNALAYYNGSKWVLINDTEGLASNVEGLMATVAKIQKQLAGLGDPDTEGSAKKYVDDADKAISDKIGAIAADATVASEITRLGGEIDAVEVRMGKAEGEIDSLQQEVEAISGILGGTGSGSITDTIDGRIDAAIALLDGSKDSTGSDEIAVKVSTADGVVSEVVVTENLAGTYATITGLNELSDTVSSNQQSLNTAISQVRTDFAAADADLRKDIDANTAKLAQLPNDKTVKQYVDDKASTLTTDLQGYTDTKVGTLETNTNATLEGINASITALGTKDTALENSINALGQKVAVPTGYATVQAYIDHQDGETLKTAKQDASDKVKALEEGKVTDNAQAIQGLNGTVATQGASIEALITKTNGHDDKLVGVTTNVGDEIKAAKAHADAKAKAVADDLALLDKEVETIAGDLESTQGDLTKEIQDRKDADSALDGKITKNTTKLASFADGTDVKKYIDDQDAVILQSAKEYTNSKISEVNSANEGLAADLADEIDRAKKAEADNAAAAKKANDALGDITNVQNAINTAASTAESNAKSEAASELAKAKGELESAIQGVNTAVATEKSRAEGIEAGLRTDVNKANSALGDITNVQNAINTAKQGAIDSANATTQSKLDALVGANGQVGKNTAELEALKSSHNTLSGTVAGHTTELANIKDDADIDSFADVKAYVNERIQASDAMVFRGTVGNGGTKASLPTDAQAGDTYKVTHVANPSATQTFAGNICSVGDLLIALVDNPTKDTDWAYVPSGGEDNTDPSLSLNGTTIELKSDAGVDLGKVSIVAEDKTAVRVTGSGSTITVSLEWGTF